ncbi:C4-dicarboxylate TRAP transporter substrate-binding protein [Paracoccus sp. (in: a-proteobacteria)]|uniref:C4-dicarboxylate TRAP transporter substrate-binding protein n=1 Tax=Paracoccus sp. TaxID=267 RepID=UPI002AFFA8CE|nr:C4-dicarboxylate TRAP transporter substrate-binding protein [Paracoccus sp. (in: a-proteobacteria)]
MSKFRAVAIGLIATNFISTMGMAKDAMLTTFIEPSHVVAANLQLGWAEAVRQASNGEMNIEVFTGGALLPAGGTMSGVADGVAQIGMLPAAYSPSELPVANAVGDLGFRKPDPYVLSFAFTDFMMNEEVGYNDWRKNGVIFGAGFSTPEYYYICNKDVGTLAEMQGKRVRLPGLGWARFGQHIGLVPVALPASEIYIGFERGALDCVSIDASALISGPTILELTKSVVMLPTMPGYSSAGLFYNPTWWKSLTNEERRLLLDQTAGAMARTQIAYDAVAADGLKQAKDRGIKLNEPDEALKKALADWVADGVGGMAELARNQHGIEDPEALFALFETYVQKWDGLVQGLDRKDEAAVTALLKTNLFDQIDEATYGME